MTTMAMVVDTTKSKFGEKFLMPVIDWMGEALSPDQVFEDEVLEAWAENNGYTRVNNEE